MLEIDIWHIMILGLAAFRLTRLIVYDKITEFFRDIFLKEVVEKDEKGEEIIYLVPKHRGILGWFGELISCYWCTGIWVSVFLLFLQLQFPTIGSIVVVILAVAAIGAIIEVIISHLLDK